MGWFGKKKAESGMPVAVSPQTPSQTPLRRHAAALYPELPAVEAERLLLGRMQWLMASGRDLEMRLAAETPRLAALDADALADRFEGTVLPRMDPIPEEPVARMAWIDDVLRSEHRDIVDGRMALGDLVRIATTMTDAVPPANEAAGLSMGRGPARVSDEDLRLQAQQMMAMPMKLLLHRFRSVGADVSGPPPHNGMTPIDWLMAGLRAEEARRLSRLAPIQATVPTAWEAALDIGFDQIRVVDISPTVTLFTARIIVDGAPVCTVQMQPDGTLLASEHAEGVDGGVIELLDRYVRDMHAARGEADALRPTTLDDVILDAVLAHLAAEEYRAASRDAVVFCPDIDAAVPRLVSVPIPRGGSREGACAHIREMYDTAVILDEVDEPTAVLMWSSLLR